MMEIHRLHPGSPPKSAPRTLPPSCLTIHRSNMDVRLPVSAFFQNITSALVVHAGCLSDPLLAEGGGGVDK